MIAETCAPHGSTDDMFDRNMRIKTRRLVLRAVAAEDRDALFEVMSDAAMSRYTPDPAWTSVTDADDFLTLASWLYDLEHEHFRYFFAVTDAGGGRLLGLCGVGSVAYDRSQNEVFFHIGRRSWGRGYATEAAAAMLDYGFATLGLAQCQVKEHDRCEAMASVETRRPTTSSHGP